MHSSSAITMKLTLIRHGESTENQILDQSETPDTVVPRSANPKLTKRGLLQAYHTGVHFTTWRLRYIWVSELDRAMQTLNIMLPMMPKSHVVTLPELNEKNERQRGIREKETLEEFTKRVQVFKEAFLDRRRGDLFIVGHSMFISILTSLLLGEPVQEPLVYRNPNCAVTRLERQEGWKLLCQGSVEHIPEHLQTGIDTK